jgi:hypothetical protein
MAWITLVIAPILILLTLGEDGRPCAFAQHYDEYIKAQLRNAAGPPPAAPK